MLYTKPIKLNFCLDSDPAYGDCLHQIYTHRSTASIFIHSLGWTRENLKEWGQFAQIICANIAMEFIHWMAFEPGTFLAGECCFININIII